MALITGTLNPDILTGTALADPVQGLGSDDVLYAFDGNDLLQGGDGDDILYAGSGNDIMDGGAGEDLFYGQSGIDTVTYASSLTALTLNLADASLSTGDAAGDFFLSIERFILGSFDDTFIGGNAGEDAIGGVGNDALFGFAGNDTLAGGIGNDTLNGGMGADSLIGGFGTDIASYSGAAGAMVLDLGAAEFTTGEAVGDVYDSIEGVVLTAFDDTLRLEGGSVRLGAGGAGNDSLNGSVFADTLQGGADDDFMSGGNGADLMDGGTGNDALIGGAGADAFVGGDGDDAVYYFNQVKVDLVNPVQGTGDAKGDTFSGIEGLVFLNAGSVYVGGAANLTVALLGASMTCFAGSGAERFQATSGILSLSYANAAAAVSFTALGTFLLGQGAAAGDVLSSVTSLTLTGLADTVDMTNFFGSSPTEIYAGNGNDHVKLLLGFAQMIDGGVGKDTIDGTLSNGRVAGGGGNDTVVLTGTGFMDGDITLTGGSGNDVVALAGYGQTTVDLGTGNDFLTISGIGNTVAALVGGLGNDTMTGLVTAGNSDGGTGNDVLQFNLASTPGSFVSLSGADGNDQISLTLTNTFGDSATAVLNGGIGDDDLSASGINLIDVIGDLGNDTVSVTFAGLGNVSGGDGNDMLTLEALTGVLNGDLGDDTLVFNLIRESTGQAQLYGGDGNDALTLSELVPSSFLPGQSAVLNGGTGDDALTVNAVFTLGLPVSFEFNPDWGNDTITNFHDGTDLIVFASTAGVGLDVFADLTVTGDTTFTLVTFGLNTIRLEGLDSAAFTDADVSFA